MLRIARKSDVDCRDERNRALGHAAEEGLWRMSGRFFMRRAAMIWRARFAGYRRRTGMARAATSPASHPAIGHGGSR